MKLIVYEVKSSGVYQGFIPDSNKNVGVLRPHLYIKNGPAGSVKVQILSSDLTLIAESAELVLSSVTASPEYHGHITFYVDAFLQKGQTYLFKVIGAAGYTYNNSAYFGVCGDFGLKKYERIIPSNTFLSSPLDFEIWTKSQK